MERIASGYALAEAPLAAPDGGLWFSDALAGGVYRWSPGAGEVETVIERRRGVGGMAAHSAGGLVVSGRDLSRVDGGRSEVLYEDGTAAGFNDLTVDPDGRLVAGVLRFRPFAGEELVPGEFVRVDGPAAAATIVPGVEWVNGCGFSPDGGAFYGCDYRRGVVLTAKRSDDGSYGAASVLLESPSGEADGLAVDENGGIWVALGGAGAVGRFRPDGRLERTIDVPAGFVASLCFGGSDGRDLFVTTGGDPSGPESPGGVFHARAEVTGAPIPAVAAR
ncbi:MAG TPA: SMP-30/gluconolactonase/LRE family protein [Solirubrobacterales bacterium]